MPYCLAESQRGPTWFAGIKEVGTEVIPASEEDCAGEAERVFAPDSERESSAARLTFAITFFAPPVVSWTVGVAK